MTAAVVFVAALCAGVVVTLALHVLSEEFSGWLPIISTAIVKSAVARLPRARRERYTEEWLGELGAFHERRLTGLLWAICLLKGSRRVADAVGPTVETAVPRRAASSREVRAVVQQGGRFLIRYTLHGEEREVLVEAPTVSPGLLGYLQLAKLRRNRRR